MDINLKDELIMIELDADKEQKLTWLYYKLQVLAYLSQAAAEREDDVIPAAEDGYSLIHDDLMECLDVIESTRSK